jgi:hypothetical protein
LIRRQPTIRAQINQAFALTTLYRESIIAARGHYEKEQIVNTVLSEYTPLILRDTEQIDPSRALNATLLRSEGSPTNSVQSTSFDTNGKADVDIDPDVDQD